MVTASAIITGLIAVFLVGACFGACAMSLFAYKSYEKGYEDGRLSIEPDKAV